ncbi:type II toxin-antitoxin system VapC family toxin [Sphaerospermopsis sp. LEGE 08334]|jgi:tRNA(fMet)-specific endonuclease VapC|uniref:type II toxin-antitoxin system VapC family toxin n=1 Tax=Sphaerospermopsis sp. LEGE 08334 TaxID=1828651 RepID=UPI00187DFBEB|nr:type II toxin-antitoxin system VapC family toxin [Sphaerospermopsis sp. LEGE 08334]MBE9058276.1 type II toxin-antitoxin system VapC family toxin [Sphaerospermopsis sp. LEGE 08334]
MTIRFLLDSNIISEPSRPIPNTQVLDQLNLYRSEVGVASVVVHEILYGCWRLPPSKRKDALWKYIEDSVLDLPVFDYDLNAAKWHAQERVRLSKIGKTPAFIDGQIASIAFGNDLILVTNNVADFQDFQGLVIENWFI